jgi:hypothetical protein
MHKEGFIINRNTLLHVSTLLGHLQGELFITITLSLHFTVEWECAVDCVLHCFWRHELSVVRACAVDCVLRCFWRRELSVVRACSGLDRGKFTPQKQCSTQSTAHSHSTVKCNLSVTVTKSSPWRWPSKAETCRSVLTIDDKTLFVHLLAISVFVKLYDTGCDIRYRSKWQQDQISNEFSQHCADFKTQMNVKTFSNFYC